MLFISHDSKLYGAPLSLLYTIQWFADRAHVQAVTIGEGGLVDRLKHESIGVTILPAPVDYRRGFTERIADAMRRQLGKVANAIRIARLARRIRPDIVYVNSVSRLTNIVGAWMSRKHVVVHVREVENFLESDSPFRRWLLRRILRLPDRFISDSAASKRVLLRVNPNADVSIVHNGVDTDSIASSPEARVAARKRFGLDSKKIIIGFVGKRSIRKGFDVFCQATREVRLRYDDTQILAIGDLHDSIVEHGSYAEGFFTLPFQADISSLYVPIDIFVMASRQEPFARVNLEAAAAGCAIVATAVDGNLELFTHEQNALLVPPGDAAAMANAVKRLITDIELRHKLADAARKMVREHYTLEICHQKILKAVEDLLPPECSFDQPANHPTSGPANKRTSQHG